MKKIHYITMEGQPYTICNRRSKTVSCSTREKIVTCKMCIAINNSSTDTKNSTIELIKSIRPERPQPTYRGEGENMSRKTNVEIWVDKFKELFSEHPFLTVMIIYLIFTAPAGCISSISKGGNVKELEKRIERLEQQVNSLKSSPKQQAQSNSW